MSQSGQFVLATTLAIAAAISLLVAVQALRRRRLDAQLFATVMFAAVIWLVGYAGEIVLASLSAKLYAARVQYVGIALLPPYWTLFALSLTSKRRWVERRTIVAVAVIPAITIALAWTSSFHDLLWSSVALDADASASGFVVTYGPWFWVHTAYSYAALVGSNIALSVMFARALRLYGRQAGLMLLGLLAPWLANIAYLLGASATTVDPTPLALAFSGVLLAWGLWRWRLLDVKPIPRARSVESMRDGVLVLDHRSRLVDFNAAAVDLLGLNGRVLGQPLEAHVPQLAALQAQPAESQRITVAKENGAPEQRVLEARLTPFADELGAEGGYWLVLLRDVTEQQRAEERLRGAEERYRTLVEQMPAVTYIREWSERLTPIYISPQVQALLGYAPESICARETPTWKQLILLEDLDEVLYLHRRALEDRTDFSAEYRLLSASDRVVWVRDEAVVIAGPDGQPAQWQGIIVDITAQKRLETQLERFAFYDTLTGLPNRALLLDRLQHSLWRVARENKLVGVLFIDLDGFKIINDTLGHVAGDRVLQRVAERLLAGLRSGDTAGRLGGDEFVVVVESVDDPATVTKIAERIIAELRLPMTIDDQEIVVSCSIGVRTSEPGDVSPDEFLRDADVAMYWAKNSGPARAVTFDASMLAHRWNRLGLEAELRTALREGQLKVFYQPIVSLPKRQLTGFEALLRWIHPERGDIPPSDFLQIAEECGLMIQIDQWVLMTACHQVADWRKRLPSGAGVDLTISVNITPEHLHQATIVADVELALRESGLPAERLMLEITENHTMRDASTVGRRLDEITQLGAKVIIDDFGTGFSALSYLRQFSITGIKIDRSFVSGLGIRTDETSLVNAVVSLARSFDLEVTAEGIETRAQWSDLDSLGADLGQGYLMARPLSAEVIDAHIESGDLTKLIHFPDQPRVRIVSSE